MSFIENKGQWTDNIQFKSELAFGNIYFEKDNFTFILIEKNEHNHNAVDFEETHDASHTDTHEGIKGHHFKINFLNANESVTFSQENKSGNYYNYFLGNNKDYWASHVHFYKAITYHNLYQGIDMKVQGIKDDMKYEYYLAPYSNPANIQVKYEGIDDLKIKNGNLVYNTTIAGVTELKPVVYQIVNEDKVFIECEYKLNKKTKTVQFDLLEAYDESIELVIDPTLIFASYTGSTLNNFGYTATYDDNGNLYGGGIIFGSISGLFGYPSLNSFNLVDTTNGSNATTFNDGFPSDMAISKFSTDGTTLLYSTLIGGLNNEQPQSLITDTSGNLYIYGRTFSANFPTTTTAFDTSYNGNGDIVVLKISEDGGTLLGSTFIGGTNADGVNVNSHPGIYGFLKYNYADDGRGEIILDEDGSVYVTSSTQSIDLFPVNTGFQDSLSGGFLQDACVFKLNNNLSSTLWGSYLGGSGYDAGYSLKLDNLGHLFVAGGTNSIDFPNTTGGLNTIYKGGQADGFIAKIDTNGTLLEQSTYIGTSNYDQSYFIEIDEFNDVFTYGQTTGSYPVTSGIYSNPNSSQFIHKLNNNLTTTEFSTVFGSGDSTSVNISPTAFLVDFCGNIYISGWGGTTNQGNNPNATGFTTNMATTIDAFQATTDGSDFYFMVLDKGARNLLYGTFFGGNQTLTGGSGEHVDGGTSRFDKNGIIYQAVCASCGAPNNNFPTTPGAWSQTDASAGGCNLGVIKMDVYIPPTIVDVYASPTATGCVPLTVSFEADLVNVNLISWDFGDGATASIEDPIHTFIDTGTFIIRLIGQDTTLCNLADTAFLTVIVGDDSLVANFIDDAIIDCYNSSVSLVTENYPTTQYLWTMGDGNTYTTDSVYHEYLNPGDYTIKLLITDSTSCELMDSAETTITILPVIEVDFAISDTFACIPLNVNYSNLTNISVDTFFWDFGDGNISSILNPSHTYANVGNYQVQLVAIDSNSCNISDTATAQVVTLDDRVNAVIQIDTLFFDCDSLLLRFSSLNENVSSYNWDFDNGVTSTDSSVIVPFVADLVPVATTFAVRYIVTDTNAFCQPIDTVDFNIRLKPEFEFNATISDSSGCLPLDIIFNAQINYPMDSFIWNFGDGNSSENLVVNYTYTLEGNYDASFLVYDTNTCNITDSIYFPIQVDNDIAIADISVNENLFSCDSLQVNVYSNTIRGGHFWDFGDGTTSLDSATNHTYINEGVYTISYFLFDSTKACNPYDTIFYIVNFESFVANLQISDTIACIPLVLNYSSTSVGQSYLWNFGNGDFSNSQTGNYTYVNTGTFDIFLIIEDTLSCNIWDTAFAQIITEDTRVEALADFTILINCDSLLSIQIDNQSISGNSYEWLFDGANMQTVEEPGIFDFTTIGNHTIQLIIRNDSLCNPLDTLIENFTLLPNTNAYFGVLDNCTNTAIQFENNSSSSVTYSWNFGNGNSSNLQNPSLEYSESGLYVITLTVLDSNTCNVSDVFTQEINVIDKAIANFETDSLNYIYPDDVYFTNLSQNFTDFIWEFGDGTTNNENENPIHSYQILYDIEPCLTVWNEHCTDTICKDIYIDFLELIGVPNAFSPNGDNINDIIYVEGIGIEQLNFKIFNRWGILVFESNDQKIGWDGTYAGVQQELEVYTYIVDALFLNEKSVILKGNITLMR